MKPVLKLAVAIGLSATFLPGSLCLSSWSAVEDASAPKEQKEKQDALVKPFADFDSRFAQIERRIVEAVENGRLDADVASTLREELEHVSGIEDSFRTQPAKLTKWQHAVLNYELDKVAAHFDTSVVDRNVPSVDLSFVKQDALKSLDLAIAEHRLTAQEAGSLKREYDKICAFELVLRQLHGRLTYADKLILCVEFDHLKSELRREMSDIGISPLDIEVALAFVEKRITEGLDSGKISKKQADDYRRQLQEIRSAEDQKHKSGNVRTPEENIAFGLSLETLANDVLDNIEAVDGSAVAARIKLLDLEIGAALNSGRLNTLQAIELRDELDALKKEDIAAPQGSVELKKALAHLENKFEHQVGEPTRLWSGISSSETHLGIRIKDGVTAKRLSEDEAKTLLSDLQKIVEGTREAKLDAGKSIEIAVALQQLSGRVDKSLQDRKLAVPTLLSLSEAIDERVGESLVNGKLSAGDAREIKLSLQKIELFKNSFHLPEGDLNARQTLAVAYELQKVYARLEERIHKRYKNISGLDKRRARLEILLEEGLASGRLSTEEVDSYKEQLRQSEKQEKDYRNSGTKLVADEALELVDSLKREQEVVDRLMRERHVTLADLVFLEGNVERKISNGFSTGLLSLNEAEILRSQYDQLVAAFLKMRAGDGGLSYGERLYFAYDFQRLAASAERNMRLVPIKLPNVDQNYVELEQRIASHMASGRLSLREALELKGLLDEIGNTAARLRASGGGLGYPEMLVVNMHLGRLNGKVAEKVSAQKSLSPDIDSTEESLLKRIKDAEVSHKLSKVQADELKAEMDRIALCELNYRTSDECLNFVEALNLMLDLERMKEAVDKKTSKATGSTKPVTRKKHALGARR